MGDAVPLFHFFSMLPFTQYLVDRYYTLAQPGVKPVLSDSWIKAGAWREPVTVSDCVLHERFPCPENKSQRYALILTQIWEFLNQPAFNLGLQNICDLQAKLAE